MIFFYLLLLLLLYSPTTNIMQHSVDEGGSLCPDYEAWDQYHEGHRYIQKA